MSEQNYRVFFDEALRQIEEDFKNNNKIDEFKLWFKMEYVEDTLSEITVSVPSKFMWQQMVTRKYESMMQEKIQELTGQPISFKPVYPEKPSAPEKTEVENPKEIPHTDDAAIAQQNSKVSVSEIKNNIKKHPQLNEDYTFDTFVAGENTDFAYSACKAVAENPGKKYNPILIYGGVGLGKTHLMESIGNYIYSKQNGIVKICYVTAENFTNEFTSSIKDSTMEKFKAKYRKLDVLLLDDIHFLQDKEATQEELFHTFEALYNSKSQMVFTCDRPITELKGIEDRLRTRFSRGMCIDLLPPNYETRRAILQKKLSIMKKEIPSDVVDYIAKNVQTNVRDLESCLNKMIGYAELLQKPLTIDIAQKELRDTFSQPANGLITIENIQKVVCNHYNISLSDIKSKKRNKKYIVPRHIAIYIARNMLDYSYPELGNEFGGRDHTSIMHGCEKITEQLKVDSALDTTIQMLMREIKDFKK
ncbi:MAG: chromosomal replication initiator protein DnaA [Treponema sp.]|nr:chromosomal replication initiator protein DnaA [Treponema sp.]